MINHDNASWVSDVHRHTYIDVQLLPARRSPTGRFGDTVGYKGTITATAVADPQGAGDS